MIDKKDILNLRGGNGELLPQEVMLELIPEKPTIRVIPLTRGEINEIRNKSKISGDTNIDDDLNVLENHLVEPNLSKDELKDLKLVYSNAMAIALLSVSTGMSQESLSKKTKKEALNEAERFL